MRPPLASPVVVSLALLLCPTPGGADVQWTQTTRTVGTEVIVTNATEFALDIDNQTNPGMGLFIAVASADTMVTGVSGASTSEQDSDLFANGLTGSGSFQTSTDVTDPEGVADAFGRSVFTGYFDLDAPTPYSLTGQLTNGGIGTSSQMALFDSGVAIVDVQGSPGTTVPIDASGTLAPGSYLVFVNMAGNAQDAPPNPAIEASGHWEMSFLLGSATGAPPAAQVPGFRVFPNPARGGITISMASRAETTAWLRIHDTAGRVVRAMDSASGSVTWDARDASGRPVPAGVYYVSVRRDREFATEKITVLR